MGNALEILTALNTLRNTNPEDLMDFDIHHLMDLVRSHPQHIGSSLFTVEDTIMVYENAQFKLLDEETQMEILDKFIVEVKDQTRKALDNELIWNLWNDLLNQLIKETQE